MSMSLASGTEQIAVHGKPGNSFDTLDHRSLRRVDWDTKIVFSRATASSDDLRSVLRQDYNAIGAYPDIAIEVKAILLTRTGCGIKAVAVLEFGILNGRTAIEAHDPLS